MASELESVSLPEIPRRVFLKRSFQLLGAAALPALAPGCASDSEAPADLRVLSPGEYGVLSALADTVIPRGGAFAVGAADVGLASRIDAALAGQGPELVRGLRAGLLALEYGAPLLAARLPRFSQLAPEERAAVYGGLAHSRVGLARDLYAATKQLCCFYFYSADAAWPGVGYDGPWVGATAT